MCSISPLTLRLHLVAAVSPISSLLLASYGWGSKLQRLGLGLGFGVWWWWGVGGYIAYTDGFLFVCTITPHLQIAPSINQSKFPDVVFCLRMRSGK